jgi:hypothetical protein
MNIDRPARTVADINKILCSHGHAERLMKGQGYVYWTDGTTPEWDSSIIYVYRLSDMTIREYLEDHNARVCKHLNRDR